MFEIVLIGVVILFYAKDFADKAKIALLMRKID